MNVDLRKRFCKRNAGLVISLLILTGLFASPVSASDLESNHAPANRPVSVLFIGNSYTYFNNLPRILEQLSASAKIPVQTRMVTAGGATLFDHWEKGAALKAIREQSWDYVVLQDQSTLGAYIIDGKNRIADPRYLHKYARLFDKEIKKSGAKTVFFLTWARKDSMERDQASLNYAYISIARELKALVAPVGIVWQRVRNANPNLALYIEDNSHPTSTGSYAAACELYAAINVKSPVGLPYQINGNPADDEGNVDAKKQVPLVNLSAQDATLIQRAAWEVHQQMRASGGYLSASKPRLADLPRLPAGKQPMINDLEGLWIGRLNFYPVPWPATMELKLHHENGNWKAQLKIKFEGHSNSDTAPEITNFKITETGVSFLDQKGVSGISIHYDAAFTGSALSGVAEAKAADKPIYVKGSWELRRQN